MSDALEIIGPYQPFVCPFWMSPVKVKHDAMGDDQRLIPRAMRGRDISHAYVSLHVRGTFTNMLNRSRTVVTRPVLTAQEPFDREK